MVCLNASGIKQSDFPAQLNGSANGLLSEEACALLRFAGLGGSVRSLGIYDYISDLDSGEQSSKLAAQMLWHFIDGFYHRVEENPLVNENDFIRYRVPYHDDQSNEMIFYKSTITERWFMEVTSNFHKNSFILQRYNSYIVSLLYGKNVSFGANSIYCKGTDGAIWEPSRLGISCTNGCRQNHAYFDYMQGDGCRGYCIQSDILLNE